MRVNTGEIAAIAVTTAKIAAGITRKAGAITVTTARVATVATDEEGTGIAKTDGQARQRAFFSPAKPDPDRPKSHRLSPDRII